MATATKEKPKTSEVAVALTEAIIAAIEDGLADPRNWQPPWHAVGFFGAHNAATGHVYRGGNQLWLSILEANGAVGPWATYKQWESLGAQVRKGEKGTLILQPTPSRRVETNAAGDEIERRWTTFRTRSVFHAGQVDGWTPPEPVEAPEAIVGDEPSEAWLASFANEASVRWGGARAYFDFDEDYIQLPARESFAHADGLFSVLWHEAGHWTGHESRLNRPQVGDKRSAVYAHEELIAELTSALMGHHFGRETSLRDDHRDYIAGWLSALRNDPDYLWSAATAADKAVAHLLSLGGDA